MLHTRNYVMIYMHVSIIPQLKKRKLVQVWFDTWDSQTQVFLCCPHWNNFCLIFAASENNLFSNVYKYVSDTVNSILYPLKLVLVTQSCLTLCNPWTIAHKALLSMEFSRQEYWSGCHFLLQGIFPTQGSNPSLLHWQANSSPLHYQGSPTIIILTYILVAY